MIIKILIITILSIIFIALLIFLYYNIFYKDSKNNKSTSSSTSTSLLNKENDKENNNEKNNFYINYGVLTIFFVILIMVAILAILYFYTKNEKTDNDPNKIPIMGVLVFSLFLLFLLLIFLSYNVYFYKNSKKSNSDSDESSTSIISITKILIDKDVPKGELPIYRIDEDGNKKQIAGGKWSILSKNIYLLYPNINTKTDIIISNNRYQVGNDTIIYKNNGECGEIIIDNYADELKICSNSTEDGYIISRNGKTIAEIKNIGEDEYELIINEEQYSENKTTFIAAFIIFNQNQMDINTSFDI